jgi:hypothetical protein
MEFHLYKIQARSEAKPNGGHTLTYVITLERNAHLIPFGEFCRHINEVIKRQSGAQELTISDIIFSLRSRLLR